METGKRTIHNNIVEYNIECKTEQYNDNGNNCVDRKLNKRVELNSLNTKNLTTTDSSKRERTSSVVFEHIVPNAVKKMWVMAESSNDTIQDDKEENSLQSGQRLKSKYGNFFISHDVAKENTESNAEILKKYKSESVSESPELPHAKNHWGVQLKPVSGNSTNEFLRSSKVSSNQRPLSIAVDDNFINGRKLQSQSRSQSLDFLDQIDGNNKDYSPGLTVQQRRKNFENSITSEQNDEQSDKYAILRTKRPLISTIGDFDLRGKSKLFYQPSSNIVANVTKAKDMGKKNARQAISLEDLLKQDEESLSVDVVEKKRASHKDTINDSNKSGFHQNGNYVLSNVEKKSVVQQNEKNVSLQKSKPVNEAFNLKNQKVSDRLKTDNKQDSYSNASSRNVKNLISDDNMMIPMNHKLNDFEFYDKNLNNSNDKNEQILKEETVKSKSDTNIKHDSYEKANITVDRFTKNIKVTNHVTSNNIGKSPTKRQNEKLTGKMKDLSKEITKEEKDPSQNDVEIKTQTCRQIIENDFSNLAKSSKEKILANNGTSVLPKNNHIVKKEIRNDVNMTVTESKSNKEFIDPKKQSPVSDIDQNLPVNRPGSTLGKVQEKPLESSTQRIPNEKNTQSAQKTPVNLSKDSQGIRRKVGKLIIMTGDQRDQQLKELEKVKKGQLSASLNLVANIPGTALTFMSNEVADDDEPLPPVPTIIFDNPLPKIKSSLSTKGRKRKFNVSFKQGNLATVYSYPSESSYLDEVDSTGQFHKTEDAVHRERDRLAHDEPTKIEIMENVNFITEGADFNSFSHEEGGSALLF